MDQLIDLNEYQKHCTCELNAAKANALEAEPESAIVEDCFQCMHHNCKIIHKHSQQTT